MAKRKQTSSGNRAAQNQKKSKFEDIDWDNLQPMSEDGDFIDTGRTPLQRAFDNQAPLVNGEYATIAAEEHAVETSSELTSEEDVQPTRPEDEDEYESEEDDDLAEGPLNSDGDAPGPNFDLTSGFMAEQSLPSSPPNRSTQLSHPPLPKPVLVSGPSLMPTPKTLSAIQNVSVPERYMMEWQRLLSFVTPGSEQVEILRMIFEQVDWNADKAMLTFRAMQSPGSEGSATTNEHQDAATENDIRIIWTGEEVPETPAAVDDDQPYWSSDSSVDQHEATSQHGRAASVELGNRHFDSTQNAFTEQEVRVCDWNEKRHYGPFLICGLRTLSGYKGYADGRYLQMECENGHCERLIMVSQEKTRQFPEIFDAAEKDLILEYSTDANPDLETRRVTVPRHAGILRILGWPA